MKGMVELVGRIISHQLKHHNVLPYEEWTKLVKDMSQKYDVSERTIRNWAKRSGVVYKYGTYHQQAHKNSYTGGYIVLLPAVAGVLKKWACHPVRMRDILLHDEQQVELIWDIIRSQGLLFNSRERMLKNYPAVREYLKNTEVLSKLSATYQMRYIFCLNELDRTVVSPREYLKEELF